METCTALSSTTLSPQPFHQCNTNGKRIHVCFQNPLSAQRLTEHCSDRELFFKLTLQRNASALSQLGSAPTLTLTFLSNHCKSNPESLKTGKNCYFLQILAQCTEMEQDVTGLKAQGYPGKHLASYVTQVKPSESQNTKYFLKSQICLC